MLKLHFTVNLGSADFAARIKINDSFKIRMNRADEICHNISILEVRKFRNHRYLTKFMGFLAHALYLLQQSLKET